MYGLKHLIECRCILAQFKNRPEPVFHKFVAFSVVDDNDNVIPKYTQCNNCGIIHKVIDVCKSQIMNGREEMRSIPSIDEIKLSLPERLTAIMESHNLELPHWEHAKFILDNERWGETITLSSDVIDNEKQIKYVKIISSSLFSVEHYTYDDVLVHNVNR